MVERALAEDPSQGRRFAAIHCRSPVSANNYKVDLVLDDSRLGQGRLESETHRSRRRASQRFGSRVKSFTYPSEISTHAGPAGHGNVGCLENEECRPLPGNTAGISFVERSAVP